MSALCVCSGCVCVVFVLCVCVVCVCAVCVLCVCVVRVYNSVLCVCVCADVRFSPHHHHLQEAQPGILKISGCPKMTEKKTKTPN